ncbi:MAG: ThiF family adenylyltransferase [Syntrophobacteraceae bacterium]
MEVNPGDRYDRQIGLPEIGPEGQAKLKNAKIFLVGAGGLASTVAFYLSAAGVGTLGIADDDRIEVTNLNRQILHNPERIGMPKTSSARQTLASFNPETEVVVHQTRLGSVEDMTGIIKNFDAVVDCTDNYDARGLINECCLLAQKPWVYGAVSGFEGQVMTILPGCGPCYRCLYPAPPPEPDIPKAAGVIGITPGIIGIIQAAEIIKYILGKGSLLVGRLLYVDLLEMDFSELQIARNPSCKHCG